MQSALARGRHSSWGPDHVHLGAEGTGNSAERLDLNKGELAPFSGCVYAAPLQLRELCDPTDCHAGWCRAVYMVASSCSGGAGLEPAACICICGRSLLHAQPDSLMHACTRMCVCVCAARRADPFSVVLQPLSGQHSSQDGGLTGPANVLRLHLHYYQLITAARSICTFDVPIHSGLSAPVQYASCGVAAGVVGSRQKGVALVYTHDLHWHRLRCDVLCGGCLPLLPFGV